MQICFDLKNKPISSKKVDISLSDLTSVSLIRDGYEYFAAALFYFSGAGSSRFQLKTGMFFVFLTRVSFQRLVSIRLSIRMNLLLMASLSPARRKFSCCRSSSVFFFLSFTLSFLFSQVITSSEHNVVHSPFVKKLKDLGGSSYTFYFVWILHPKNFSEFKPLGPFPLELVFCLFVSAFFLSGATFLCTGWNDAFFRQI